MLKLCRALGIAALSLGAALPAATRADIITFDIGTGNSALSGYSGPFEQVTVNRTDSTHATISFVSFFTNPGNVYLMGDGGTVAVNVNATSWTIGSFLASNSGTGFSTTSADLSSGGAGNEDGFGSFNQTVNSFDGFSHSADHVSFVLTNTSGTWANASSVLTGNASGFLAAAHVFVTSYPANQANGAIVTGFATNGSTSSTGGPSGSG